MPHSQDFLSLHDRPALTAAEMRRREDQGTELGISKLVLMENAGSNVARFVMESVPEAGRVTRICIVAGTGNNGGDVFVAARHLSYWKDRFEINLFLIGKADEILAEEAKTNWNILGRISAVRKVEVDSKWDLDSLKDCLTKSETVVVGIFGTGFRGEPRDFQREVIQIINQVSNPKKISVDLPSGMEADTGNFKVAVKSDFTITMDSPKQGMLKESTKQICGEILVANIGLPLE